MADACRDMTEADCAALDPVKVFMATAPVGVNGAVDKDCHLATDACAEPTKHDGVSACRAKTQEDCVAANQVFMATAPATGGS